MKQRGEARPQELKYIAEEVQQAIQAAFNVNALIVFVVADSMVDKVVENILSSSSTGLAGEGKMFVSDVDDAVDIGSRTRGEVCQFKINQFKINQFKINQFIL